MKCTILHEGKGRMRVHVEKVRMTLHRADVLEAYLNHHDAIVHAAVYERTGDVVITYTGRRSAAIAVLAGYKFDVAEYDALVTSADSRRLNREYQDKMFDLVAGRCLRKLFLPAPLDAAYTAFRSIRFLWKGVRCVLSRRLEVEVLDALSIGVSLLRGDFGTAGSVMFLLNLGSLLEEWTRKKSLDDLARSMALNVDKVWVRSQGTEVLVPLTKVRSGDEVVVRSGNMIPLDGTVLEGEAMVNQAALTGEAMPVRKAEGSTLYAGTVVEEGECVFIAKAEGGSNRYDKIVAMIEESEKLKSSTENRALELADKLVPWCLGATVVTYLLTRNATRAISCLMVDFSCALKLSMPLAVLSAMRECGSYHITVKGGKYLEALANADTIVFDKTGTLTNGAPALTDVCPCSGVQPETLVRLAAALEQCSDHPLARAVTAYAQQQSDAPLPPTEDFSYALGRGVRGTVAGAAVVCGSRTWLRELGIDMAALAALPDLRAQAKTELCVARGGVVLGTLGIADTRKSEAAAVVAQLRAAGKEVWMMTGDHARTAEAIAAEVGIGHVLSEVRPDEKAAAIERLRAQGKTVCMVGDGINDTPALAVADCAVAMGGGSDIAIESAGILLPSGNLEKLPELFDISRATIRTIRQNLTWALFYNLVSIPVAALGVLHPSICATAMSASSIGVLMHSLRLKDSGKKERRFPWKKKS